ncbi:hypothetical protein [Nocardioides ferulae]|uniref:hypothetical protein n=1 Tax=Nocardioides ferulae TaxID=2340821 RepID=UPI000EB19420|nr:hypothetical protein [Nocardioides ferulae]
MTADELRRYTGNSPLRVSKDAKYTVTVGGAIRLEYQESQRVRWMLTSDDHPDLAEMVNVVKEQVNDGRRGGAFYINEFKHVLVPDGKGGSCYWAGRYDDKPLVFEEGSLTVTPAAPPDLTPGDLWPGPHVGIPYVLNAGATDIRYEKVDGRRRETVYLSDDVGASAARDIAGRLGKVKGTQGGRIFINEEYEIFAPVGVAGDWQYIYLGPLGESPWFLPPEEFE